LLDGFTGNGAVEGDDSILGAHVDVLTTDCVVGEHPRLDCGLDRGVGCRRRVGNRCVVFTAGRG
jgi:hypothetical protein